jgi:fructokinase
MGEAKLFAGIEAGGTKFNCVVGRAGGDIVHQQQFTTTHPEKLLPQLVHYFAVQSRQFGELAAMAIGSFGPLQLDPLEANYGCIVNTPKPGWSGFNWLEYWRSTLKIPLALQTDVNVALIAEHQQGEAKGLLHAVYVTIGTGIGAGVMLNGQLVQGASHPELGHMRITRYKDDSFLGGCPYHQDCLEGLASGPALAQRWMQPAQQLHAEHPAWAIQAFYLAQMCMNITLSYGPQRIVLGGGVAAQAHLLPLIRREFVRQINGYCSPHIITSVDTYIQRSALGSNAGQIGCLLLAEATWANQAG